MASLPRTSTVSGTSSSLGIYNEQQVSESTENEAFLPNEIQAPSGLNEKDERAHTHPSISPKDHTARQPISPNDDKSGSITNIVVGFVAGVALAISHHIFLAFLNGRNIDEYPQRWVKNANNAFSALFSLCIALIATYALIQMKGGFVSGKPSSMRASDNLFALPSLRAPGTTVTSTRGLRSQNPSLIPISAAIFIPSLALVSIFAANALTVTRSAEILRDITVPTLDLSKGPLKSAQRFFSEYTTASQSWNTVLTSVMIQSPLVNWKIPPGCGPACKFDLVYEGPGLQCVDTPLDPPPSTGDGPFPLVYNATSTLYPNPRANSSLSYWEIEDQYELRVGYITTDNRGRPTGRDGGSVHCVFRNATYKASFQVENNTMEVNHAIQSYGGILGTVKYGLSDPPCSWHGDHEPCFANGVNTRAMCEVFASAFTGTIQFLYEDEPVTDTTGGLNEVVIDRLFSHSVYHLDLCFHLTGSNLSESLVGLFSNLTLGFIPWRTDTTIVQAEIWDGYTWSYTVWNLWPVYLPPLLLASLVVLNGWLSIR